MTQRAEIPARKGEQRRGDTNNFFTNLGVIYIMEPTEDNAILEKVVGFDALYESMLKCIRGYLYKDSVAHFFLNGIESVLTLEAEHKNGTYKARKPHKFKITFPKPRDAVSISFRDRVYQRSLNDNVITPSCHNNSFKIILPARKERAPIQRGTVLWISYTGITANTAPMDMSYNAM